VVCELCHKNVATVHLTEVAKGGIRELHFCDDCARQKGVSYKSAFPTGLVEHLQQALAAKPSARAGPDPKCSDCGMTYGEFRAKARFGCANDYTVFRTGILPLLEKIHGATTHTGKIPRRAEQAAVLAREISALESSLQRLVHKEAFEEAATVRNRIRSLKDQLAAGEKKP